MIFFVDGYPATLYFPRKPNKDKPSVTSELVINIQSIFSKWEFPKEFWKVRKFDDYRGHHFNEAFHILGVLIV